MRKYQRKEVAKLRRLYQSNDPLRWYDMKVLTRSWSHAYLMANKRERKLIHRRWHKNVMEASKALRRFGMTMLQATEALRRAFAGEKVTFVTPRPIGKTMLRNTLIGEPIVSKQMFGVPKMRDLQIFVDESKGDDDAR